MVRRAGSYRPPASSASPDEFRYLSGDSNVVWEFGLRRPADASTAVSGGVTVSVGRWRNVQADLADQGGRLLTANVGDADFASVAASGQWRLSPNARMNGGITANRSSLRQDGLGILNGEGKSLPNVPDMNAELAFHLQSSADAGMQYQFMARARYVGQSTLGVDPTLRRRQGGYAHVDAALSLEVGLLGGHAVGLHLDASNVLDAKGARFAFGSIAQPAEEALFIPQAPRTISLGIVVTG